ncbi:MAG: hypothetical protein GX959_05610 [Clostridiales bacterium]|nr:hypothetical protein [Clostridiales bacterium]
MIKARTGKFLLLAAAMLVLLIFCVISFAMPKTSAEALTQEELKTKYDFTVDKGTYLNYGVMTDIDNIPVFTIKLNRQAMGAYSGENKDIRFYYAFSSTVVDPLTASLVWTKLQSEGDLGEGGGISQYDETTGIATLDFSLDQVFSGHLDGFLFNKFVYFKVENSRDNETYISTVDVQPENPLHKQVVIDFTPDTIKQKYSFTLDTGEYMSGVTFYGATDFPEFTATLNDPTIIHYANLKYALSDTFVTDPLTASFDWTETGITKYSGQDIGEWNISLLSAISSTPEDFMHKFMYFKVESEGLEQTEIYIPNTWIEIIIDKTTSAVGYDIVSVKATYNDGVVVDKDYPIANQVGQKWVSSGVTLEVKTRSQNPATRVYYMLYSEVEGAMQEGSEMPFDYNAETQSYVATILSDESPVNSYGGKIGLRSRSGSDNLHRNYQGDLKVFIDKVEPVFSVSAIKDTTGSPDYIAGTWSSVDVKYIVTPSTTVEIPSGARYQYLSETGWADMNVDGAGFSFRANESMSLSFRSVSGSGIEYFGGDFVALIDKVKPILNMTAKDGNGTTIVSMGIAPGPGARSGYAQNSIRFTLKNDAIQGDVRNNVFFEYRTSPTGQWVNIPATSGNFILEEIATLTSPIVRRTYEIRVRTSAGTTDQKVFTVSVLREKFQVNMQVRDYHPTASIVPGDIRSWANQNVSVDFTLPVHLNIDEEYEIYGYITGNIGDAVKLPYTRSAINAEGKAVFTVEISKELDGQSYSFYIFDKARNRVEKDIANTSLTTTLLNLDPKTPDAQVSSVLTGRPSFELGPNDWAAGEVTIIITPEENISGTVLYRMVTDEQESTTPETMISGGKFEILISAEGARVYKYKLKSGAGLYKIIEVPVNIDTSAINFTGIEADLIGLNGEVIEQNIPIDGSRSYAQNIKVRFNTNHAGHFRYFVAPYTSVENPYAPPEAYTQGVGETMSIAMPLEGGKGEFKYIFYLESRTESQTGEIQRTGTHYVHLKYDVRNYNISISGPGSEWTDEAVAFSLTNESKSDYETDPIVITKYQYQLTVGLNAGQWMDVDELVDSEGDSTFLFNGIKWYFNTAESVDDESENELDPSSVRKYRSYNGTIIFRAINAAGHPSATVETTVKMDTSTPNVIYAISAKGGEIVKEAGNEYRVYNYNPTGDQARVPSLISTEIDAMNNPSSIFKQKAPIRFYYRLSSQSETVAPSVTGPGWTLLTQTYNLTGQYYWMYATNGLSLDTPIAYRVRVYVETTELKATIGSVSGGTMGILTGDNYGFNWTDRATVSIKPTSETAVYYWYKINNGEWVKYNSVPKPSTSIGLLHFCGAADPSYPDAVIINFKGTVQFKITNQSGAEKILDRAAFLKIDINRPRLEIENIRLSTTEVSNISIEDAKTRWYSSAILVEVVGNDDIPSGVIYQYRIKNTEDYQHMKSNRITTDDIIPPVQTNEFKEGNGTITIELRAKSYANESFSMIELTFNVDKIMPEFKLVGQEMTEGIQGKRLESGQWTKAPEVVISREVINEAASIVTYTYHDYETPENKSPWEAGSTLSFNLISRVVVEAINQAGLKVTKEFLVNIDSVPPVIHSGIIVNSAGPEPNVYYIDQAITYTEDNLDYARYNNFPLSNGMIIATNTVDNSNNGLVHIVVADKAGNKAELKFYMTVFPLTVSGEHTSIELKDEHLEMLNIFEQQYNSAVLLNALIESRSEYFRVTISRLKDRVYTLEKQVEDYRNYLEGINARTSFELASDYPEMKKYIDYFTSPDPLVVYPEWQQLKIREGTHNTYYEKLLSEYQRLNSLMQQVRNVEKQTISLPATNIVTRSDYEAVRGVYAAYLGLSVDQKGVFTPNLVNKLTELKRICEVLKLQDEKTGVKIYGDKLVAEGDVEVAVFAFEESTERYQIVQKTLMDVLPVNESRALMSLYQVGLEGVSSQYDTGNITVTLPIPEDYREYKVFAVYRVHPDGTISPVEGVMIDKTGTSVSFAANRLDTYALATTANIVARPEDEKVYGSIAGIELDYNMLTYLAYGGAALLGVMFVVILVMIIRKRRFLRIYNRSHKHNIVKKGIHGIPAGNAPPPSNPARPEERVAPPRTIQRYGK